MVPGEPSAAVAAPQPLCPPGPRAVPVPPHRRLGLTGALRGVPQGTGGNGKAVAALKRYLTAAAIASVTCPHPLICQVFVNTRLYHFFINAFNHESPNKRVSFKHL